MASPADGAEALAARPAPVWGPAVSIAALVAANLLALLLNPGLFRSCFRSSKHDATAADDLSPASASAPPPPPGRPPRRVRCAPVPSFASNLNEEAARRARACERAPPLPREFWGFDVLSPRDPLSSYLAPRSVRPTAVAAALPVQSAGEAPPPPWSPATWVLLPLFILVFGYFVAYVLLETLWRE